MRRFGVREGIVVTKDEAGKMNVGEGEVRLIPAEDFMLSPRVRAGEKTRD